ncbi:MAG: methyltransferase [Aigarchaeota archaeon]|nr:methyltransferase [Aigarchaeota archaeon]
MRFQPIRRPLICKPVAEELLRARSRGWTVVQVSLDLGRSLRELRLSDEGICSHEFELGWDYVELAANRDRDIYCIEGDKILPLSITSDHFYKLVLVSWGHAPTLEIDGIHMHRILEGSPEADSEMKVGLLGKLKCQKVLDICTGLGYTAIAAKRMGACEITTIEKDVNVIRLAQYNPWSWDLEDESIELRIGDAVELVGDYHEEFDVVIHDPPRFSLAGELYGLHFYKKLAKAIRPGGKIVHYVGQPGIHRGRKIWKGILERMKEAGFDVRYDERTRCVYGYRKQ